MNKLLIFIPALLLLTACNVNQIKIKPDIEYQNTANGFRITGNYTDILINQEESAAASGPVEPRTPPEPERLFYINETINITNQTIVSESNKTFTAEVENDTIIIRG